MNSADVSAHADFICSRYLEHSTSSSVSLIPTTLRLTRNLTRNTECISDITKTSSAADKRLSPAKLTMNPTALSVKSFRTSILLFDSASISIPRIIFVRTIGIVALLVVRAIVDLVKHLIDWLAATKFGAVAELLQLEQR